MKIGDDYEITSDKYNFILRQCYMGRDKRTRLPKQQYRETYYATLNQACGVVLAREVSKSMEGSCRDVIAAITNAQELIEASVRACGARRG